jgi:hypothetical protein
VTWDYPPVQVGPFDSGHGNMAKQLIHYGKIILHGERHMIESERVEDVNCPRCLKLIAVAILLGRWGLDTETIVP